MNESYTNSDICRQFVRNWYYSVLQNLDYFEKPLIFIIILNALLMVTSTLGNSMILVTIFNSRSLQTPSYILISSLAVIDLLVGLIGHPLFIALAYFQIQRKMDMICLTKTITNIIGVYFAGISFATSLLISIDRYLALTLVQRYKSFASKKTVILIVSIIWATMLPPVILSQIIEAFRKNWGTIASAIGFPIFIATLSLHIMSFLNLQRYTSRVHAQRLTQQQNSSSNFDVAKYKRTLKTMLIIFGCLAVCCIPVLSAPLVLRFSSVKLNFIYQNLSVIFFSLNSSLNPVIYVIAFRDIRCALRLRACTFF